MVIGNVLNIKLELFPSYRHAIFIRTFLTILYMYDYMYFVLLIHNARTHIIISLHNVCTHKAATLSLMSTRLGKLNTLYLKSDVHVR